MYCAEEMDDTELLKDLSSLGKHSSGHERNVYS